jgi:multidrug efflux system membrane fusion protein
MKKFSVLVIFGIIAVLGIWFGFGQARYNKNTQFEKAKVEALKIESADAFKVKVQTVDLSDFKPSYEYYGNVKYDEVLDIYPEINSKVEKILVHEGEDVRQGQVMFELEERDLKNSFFATRANLTKMENEFRTNKQLAQKGLISESQFEIVKTQFEQAKRDFESTKKALDNTKIKAPFNGVVQEVYAKNNQSVFAGQTSIAKIISHNKLYVSVPVPLEVSKKLKISQFAEIFSEDDGVKYNGKIGFIGHQTTDAIGTVDIKVVPLGKLKLVDGQVVRVKFDLETVNGFEIPLTSLLFGDNNEEVGIKFVDENSLVKFIAVEVVSYLGESVFVVPKNEVNSSIKLVVVGQNYVKSGEKVSI